MTQHRTPDKTTNSTLMNQADPTGEKQRRFMKSPVRCFLRILFNGVPITTPDFRSINPFQCRQHHPREFALSCPKVGGSGTTALIRGAGEPLLIPRTTLEARYGSSHFVAARPRMHRRAANSSNSSLFQWETSKFGNENTPIGAPHSHRVLLKKWPWFDTASSSARIFSLSRS